MLYQKESRITRSICLDLPLQQFSIHRAASRREISQRYYSLGKALAIPAGQQLRSAREADGPRHWTTSRVATDVYPARAACVIHYSPFLRNCIHLLHDANGYNGASHTRVSSEALLTVPDLTCQLSHLENHLLLRDGLIFIDFNNFRIFYCLPKAGGKEKGCSVGACVGSEGSQIQFWG